MTVGLVIVSHSERIAEGVVELASQMAGNVRIVAAGGTDDGKLGTSFEKISSAIDGQAEATGIVLLCDLGSAVLTAETVLDFLPVEARERIRIADAPLVEGAIAAAVAAEIGGDLVAVVAAAESAGKKAVDSAGAGRATGHESASVDVVLTNKLGLHARPAAEFVKAAVGYAAEVTVNGVNAKSLLLIMSLGLVKGDTATIRAEGADAPAALDALVTLLESGFGED